MEILKIFNCLLFAVIFSVTTNAQLIKLTAPNLLTETDVYQNAQGVMYANEVKFGFNKKLLNMAKGEAIVNTRNIMYSGFRNALSELNRKYGNFTIIKVNPNIQWGDTIKVNRRTHNLVRVKDLSQEYIIKFSNLVPYDSIATYIKTIPNVNYAEGPMIAYLTGTIPDDPWYYNSSSQGAYKWSFDVIHAQDAWNVTHGSPLIRVGIHDRFDVQIPLHNEITGKVVWESSWNALGYHGDHGTMSAGIVGASTNNNTDIASLGWNTSLMLAEWGYQYNNSYGGIRKLVDNGADIINFSWVTGYSNSLGNEIKYALQQGVICVASAGNDEWTIPGLRYPAAFNFGSIGQVIAVSGTEINNGSEKFISNFNYSPGTDPINDPTNSFIDCAAPGANYRSLSFTNTTGTEHIWFGTSVSSPFVSATVALMLSVNSTLTPNDVYDILKRTTDRVGQFSFDTNGWNRYLGYGRIDAANAVYVAAGMPAKPRGMALSWSANHPKISWEPGTETNIDHYEIYKIKNSLVYTYLSSTQNTYFIDNSELKYSHGNPKAAVYYKVKVVNSRNDGSVLSDSVKATVNGSLSKSTGSNGATPLTKYDLFTNYPNPFNPSTNISYQLPEKGFVVLKVYNPLGKEVATLVNSNKDPGNYSVTFNASNLPSGLYLYKLQVYNSVRALKFTKSNKMILLK